MHKTKGFVYLLIASMIFGSFGVWVRILNNELLPYQQILLRGFTGSLVAFIIVINRKKAWISNKLKITDLLIFMFTFPLVIVFFTLSAITTKIALTTFALYISVIIFSYLFGYLFYKEKLNRINTACAILVLIGLIFIANPFQGNINIGIIYGLLGGFFSSINYYFRKKISGVLDNMVLVLYQLLGVLIAGLFLTFFSGQSIPWNMSFITMTVGVMFGSFLVLVNLLTLTGLKYFPLNLGSVILSAELVWASIYALVIFREVPTFYELIGGILILMAAVLPNLKLEKK
jgi:drug/metabolite transporter (DMT)-like permease